MASRMDKYHSNDATSIQSRSSKNKHLYEELYTNKVFTEFTNEPTNIVDLSNLHNTSSINRREQFQKSRLLNQDEETKKYSFDYLENTPKVDKREKNYNINDILEDARKNRKEEDELEKKRRIKSVEYSILSDLSQEKIKEYHDKKNKLTKDEEENLEELIHTITSNSLRKKIDDELLGDLLPTEESETIISKELLEKLDEAQSSNVEEVDSNQTDSDKEKEEDKIDNSFYTRSMDLSEEDFEFDEEDRSFIDEKGMGIVPKILIGLFIIAVIIIIVYVVYKFI